MKSFALFLLTCAISTAAAADTHEKIVVPRSVLARDAPQPKYPLFAALRGEQGTGFFVMRVVIKTGRVKEVQVLRSTGHSDLDTATVKALKRWTFKPGALPPITKIIPHSRDPLAAEDSLVKTPVTFEIRKPQT